MVIIELFAHCKGGNFNIHIWAWFGYVICLTREIRFYLQFGEEVISCLGRVNVRAFHENPNRIHTELTSINPYSASSQNVCFLSFTKIFEASQTNSVDPDQTAVVGAV